MFESKFMKSIKKIYISYKNNVKDLIKSFVEGKAIEFIEYQANLEKKEGNMNLENRRTSCEFKKTNEIFLKKNYYFIVQNYIINYIINSPNNYFGNFLASFFNKIKSKFLSLSDINYLNYSNQISNKIRNCLEYCFKKKLSSFSIRNNIGINYDDNQSLLRENIFFVGEINFENDYNNDRLNNNYKNTDSLIFNKIDNTKQYLLPKISMYIKFHFENEHKSSFINKELNLKMQNFVTNIKCQNFTINNLDDDDLVFNFFLNQSKGNLLNYINSYESKYLEEINTCYNLGKENNNIIFVKDEINSQIEWRKIELYYKNAIHNSFITNYINKNNKYENSTKLKYITIILAGKSGVGKSTLINCFFKRRVATEGLYKVCTMGIKSHKLDFLKLIDTRGYELNPEYPPNESKKDVLSKIKSCVSQDNYNDLIHCIWFCVHGNALDNTEKKALKELKNNEYNVPLIVVFTNAQIEDDVKNMKKEIYNLFHEDIFIDVLGRKTEDIPAYGLDDLFNKTLEAIKLNNTSNYFMRVKNKFKDIKKAELTKVITNIKENIINKIADYFIQNYDFVKNENSFEDYVFELLKKIIMLFTNYEEFNNNQIKFQKSKIIREYIQSCIKLYTQVTENLINNILDKISLEILDMQVDIERLKNASIKPRNKKNRDELKQLITQFLKDNFYHLGQKYLIYKFINNLFGYFIEIIGKLILEKIEDILENNYEIKNDYKSIYLKMFEEYEQIVDSFRDDNKILFDKETISKNVQSTDNISLEMKRNHEFKDINDEMNLENNKRIFTDNNNDNNYQKEKNNN